MNYDVAIVGAGPAGLMAAKTASEKGLKVVVIEKRRDISSITRACCQQLIMDEDFQGETIKVSDGKIHFTVNNFSVDYTGPLFEVTEKHFISPGGRRVKFKNQDASPIVIKFDKGMLLKNLWNHCEEKGVTFLPATVAYDVADTGTGVEVKSVREGEKMSLKASKLILADGVNAGIADALGLNSQRMLFATGLCILYYLEGIKDFDPKCLKAYFGRAYMGLAPIMTGPTLDRSGAGYLVITGNRTRMPEDIFRDVTQKGALSPVLRDAKIVHKTGCSVRAFSSMKVPFKGNILVIGDAAAYVEVETQGALTCGYRAGNSVAEELSGKNGFEAYTAWWQKSFEFNGDDYLQVAQGFVLVPTYTDAELDYLFGLIEDAPLPGTYNQYRSPRLLWGAILKHSDRIKAEKPETYEKITNKKVSLSDML